MSDAARLSDWPSSPYRGLDFYDEVHAPLFRERDAAVQACVNLLGKYNVKILVLHGSSGAGKSSFLRAGLNPALKHLHYPKGASSRQALLLNYSEGVIRCTSDPIYSLSRAILSALADDHPIFIQGEVPAGKEAIVCFAEDPVRKELRETIITMQAATQHIGDEHAVAKTYNALAKTLVDVLAKLCGHPDSRLFLILDQVEEVLTRTTATQLTSPAASAFFLFLEETYVRNINMRLILSIRTEYYGRFRNELRISDTRLGSRPDEQGLEPFLLRPIRARDALIGAFAFPATGAKSPSGQKAYPFSYESGLLEKIVDDVLSLPELGEGSVTPLISMACTDLHSRLPNGEGIIRCDYYGGILQILRDYVQRGLGTVATFGTPSADKWLELLYSTLVSRQGGGTVVSLTENADAICRRAKENQLGFDEEYIKSSLLQLSMGAAPLLRAITSGEQVEQFSLKHDALAVIIDRQHTARIASAREAQRAEEERRKAEYERTRAESERARADREKAKADRQKARSMVHLGLAIIIGLILAGTASMAYYINTKKTESEIRSANAIADSIQLRNSYVSRPAASDFRLGLLILIANLNTIDSFIQNESIKPLQKVLGKLRNETIAELRKALMRSPYFVGRYLAVGFDAQEKQLALVQTGDNGRPNLIVIKPSTSNLHDIETVGTYQLPTNWQSSEDAAIPVVGFLNSLGPALYIQGRLFYWDGPGHEQKQPLDLRPILGDWLSQVSLAEFAGGRLVIKTQHQSGWEFVRLDGDAIRRLQENGEPAKPPPVVLPKSRPIGVANPPPVVSDPNTDQYWATLASGSEEKLNCGGEDSNINCRLPKLVQMADDVDVTTVEIKYGKIGQARPKPRFVGLVPTGRTDRQRRQVVLSFAAGTNVAALRGESENIWINDLSQVSEQFSQLRIGNFPDGADREASLRYAPFFPWFSRPFALSRRGEHWVAAWISDTGVWAAESAEATPRIVVPMSAGSFLTGAPGGTAVTLSEDGSRLLLTQTSGFGSYTVRLYDLEQSWIDRVAPSVAQMKRLACSIIKNDGGNVQLDRFELNMFNLENDFQKPCEKILD